MAQKHNPKYRKQQPRRSSAPVMLALTLFLVVLVVLSLGLRMLLRVPGTPEATDNPTLADAPSATDTPDTPEPTQERTSWFSRLFGRHEEETEPETQPEPEHVVSTATVGVTGDILMHMPVINTGLQPDGSYSFDYIFRYLAPYTQKVDWAVANLETTLCGTDKGYKYSGYPAFNCPDEIVDALKNAGFDMLLTANNHCYDTSEYGFLRTVRTVREKGLTVLGTRAAAEEPTYLIQEINGIKVGMVCYTYEGPPENPTARTVYMNKNALSATCAPLINSFLSTQLDPFYLEVRGILEEMKRAGAEATIMFIHWGTEYQTAPNLEQNNIAQQLCDIGFDVIVGGHPHVIQPIDLLTSRLDPDHKTVCLYSTGNAVSNQRISEMDLKTGHTEDALLFQCTFSKYSDGTVYLENVDILPIWVDLRTEGSKEYDMIPLDLTLKDQWQSLYDLSAEGFENAQKSYTRTNDLTGTGLALARSYLSDQKQQRETDYLAAVTQADAA